MSASMNDLCQEAIVLEQTTRDYYLELGRKTIARYAGPALKRLAAEEQKHMDLLAEYRKSQSARGMTPLPDASGYAATWQAFIAALDEIREAVMPHTDEITVVQHAITLEEKGLAVYRNAAGQARGEPELRLFTFLADQETHHKSYLESLLRRLLVLYEEPPETRPQL